MNLNSELEYLSDYYPKLKEYINLRIADKTFYYDNEGFHCSQTSCLKCPMYKTIDCYGLLLKYMKEFYPEEIL